jgi:glycosyltransferase involved in cell wall biosynthesis
MGESASSETPASCGRQSAAAGFEKPPPPREVDARLEPRCYNPTSVRTVLFTETTHVTLGGVGRRHSRLAELLPSRGWRPIFALTWGRRFHNPFRYRETYPSLDTVLLDGRTGTRDGRLLAIQQAIEKARPSAVIPGAVSDTFAAVAELKAAGSPIRLVYGLPGLAPAALEFLRLHAPIVDLGFGVSRLTRAVLECVCGFPADRVRRVPTAVPAARRDPFPPDGVLRVGLIGRLDADKRSLDVLDVCSRLDGIDIQVEILVCGSGNLLGTLQSQGENHFRRGRLRYLGVPSTDRLYDEIYPRLDACLLFSPAEGSPNSLMEAMGHRAVPITSDFRGRAEEGLIRHLENALVFPVGDTRLAAEHICLLAREGELRRRLALRASQDIEDCHGVGSMADAFAAVLDHAVEAPQRRGSVPMVPAQGRLEPFLSRSARERLRRLLGRQFDHVDASEWPLIENWPLVDPTQIEFAVSRAAKIAASAVVQ